MGGMTAASRSAPVGSAVASEAALHGVKATLKTIEPEEEPITVNDGKHAMRALRALEAQKRRY